MIGDRDRLDLPIGLAGLARPVDRDAGLLAEVGIVGWHRHLEEVGIAGRDRHLGVVDGLAECRDAAGLIGVAVLDGGVDPVIPGHVDHGVRGIGTEAHRAADCLDHLDPEWLVVPHPAS